MATRCTCIQVIVLDYDYDLFIGQMWSRIWQQGAMCATLAADLMPPWKSV
jgi:hypothetical protein